MTNNNFLKLIIIILVLSFIAGLVFIINSKPFSQKPVACTQEAKLCSDGSYVGRTGEKCEFALCPKENLIKVENPMANEKISSPILIKGQARGAWFFEASFPIKLYDSKNQLIAQYYATAQGEWMTENFVPFEASLEFIVDNEQAGTLVLEKDNPSGLPEYADELRIPVMLSPSKTVKLFYYNQNLDKDGSGNIKCSKDGLAVVERNIPISQTPIQDTIMLLLKGELTAEEKSQGITTEFPLEGLSLKGASVKDGVLTIAFEDPNSKTVGGACRVSILWRQIEATAKQFPGIKQVTFMPEELFQP